MLWHKAGLYDPSRSSLSTLALPDRPQSPHPTFSDVPALASWTGGLTHRCSLSRKSALTRWWQTTTAMDAHVRAAVSRLPEEQREMLRAAFFLGQSHSEIRRGDRIAIGTVKSRIRLALWQAR